MTEQQIREAATAAVADFPPLPEELVARLGTILAPVNDAGEGGELHGQDQNTQAA